MNIERWDTFELAYQAMYTYDNPFRDVDLRAAFTHGPSGKSITVNGFYDGDSTWRIRFMPTELGEWTYSTQSGDPGLDSKTGSFICVKPTKSYLHGPISCKGYHFVHADGTPRFLISTRLSCQFGDRTVWPHIVAYLQTHRINRVLFMMVGIDKTTKDLYGDGVDFDRYNVERFQAIDAFIDTLRQADILAAPYFYYFNDKTQRRMTADQDRAYIRYGMARFGAYANVMPVLSNEVEQKYTDRTTQYDLHSHTWANEMGRYLKAQAVFGLPVAVHNPQETENAVNPGFYTLLADWPFPWTDYMLRQAQVGALGAAPELRDDLPEQKQPVYDARAYARHHQLLINLRRFGIPVINEEPGYEMGGASWEGGKVNGRPWCSQTAWTLLNTFWSATCAGAYVMWGNPATYEMDNPMWGLLDSVVPQRLRIMHDFMMRLPYWEMEPHNELVSANEVEIEGTGWRTNFCLAKPGEYYLIFSLKGGPLQLTLQPGVLYNALQLDPRTGEEKPLGEVAGGVQSVTLAGREQVLLVKAR